MDFGLERLPWSLTLPPCRWERPGVSPTGLLSVAPWHLPEALQLWKSGAGALPPVSLDTVLRALRRLQSVGAEGPPRARRPGTAEWFPPGFLVGSRTPAGVPEKVKSQRCQGCQPSLLPAAPGLGEGRLAGGRLSDPPVSLPMHTAGKLRLQSTQPLVKAKGGPDRHPCRL